MNSRWTDEELLRFCVEGPFENVSPDLLDALRHRWFESDELKQAVEVSPKKAWLLDQLAHVPAATVTTPAKEPSTRWVVAFFVAGMLLAAGFLLGRREYHLRQQDLGDRETISAEEALQVDRPAVLITPAPESVSDGQSGSKPADKEQVAAADKPRDEKPVAAPDPAPAKPSGTQPVGGSADSKVAAASPKEAPKPVAPPVEEVWAGPLDLQKPPVTVESAVWQGPGMQSPDSFNPDAFRKWFGAYPGRPFNVGPEAIDSRVFTIFDGQARLRAPWVDASTLRLGIYDVERASIQVWKGNAGIKLTFYRNQQPQVWGAHRIVRTDANAVAVSGELLATDCARWQISHFGTMELRFEQGKLILSRGNIPLLHVPFEGRPEEVTLDGKFKVRDFRMYRSDPLDLAVLERFQPAARVNRLVSSNPAAIEWKPFPLEGVSFEKVTREGANHPTAVELKTTASVKEMAFAGTQISKAGLSEIVFRVDHADPGTGLCLGSATGPAFNKLAFLWDPLAGRLAATIPAPWENIVERPHDPNVAPPPFSGPTQWYRLISCAGTVTAWVSHDGQSWSWLGQHYFPNEWRRLEAIRLFAMPGAERRIRLSHLEVREFATIASVADEAVCQRVDIKSLDPVEARDFGSWLQQVVRSRPADVSFDAWRRACAVETLRAGCHHLLGQSLLTGLVFDGLFETFDSPSATASPERLTNDAFERGLLHDLQLLSEAAVLHHLHDYNLGIAFTQLWDAVAEKWVLLAEKLPAGENRSLVSETCLTGMLVYPLWSAAHMKLLSVEPCRRELVSLVNQGRSADTMRWIDRLTFLVTNSHPHHFWWSQVDPIYNTVMWAELSSHRGLDGEAVTRRSTMPRRWKAVPPPLRHSLAQPLSKEAYNVMAEFNAAISGKAFGDACQVIGSAASGHLLGVLPDSRDDKLLVAFPNAVALAMEDYPELRAAMNDKYGAVGRLRVRQAIESGNSELLEAATVQFFGTLAAAESERWLGDHAFSAGYFAQARGHYQRALEGFRRNSQVETAEMAEVMARMQLVGAMLGTTEIASLPPTVSFADQTLTKDQLVALTQDLAKASGAVLASGQEGQRTASPVPNVSAVKVPLLTGYKLEARSKFEGDLGEHAGNGAPGDVDWFSRQFAITADGPLGYLCNRFQLTCLDLATAQVKWTSPLGAEHGHANHLPMVPMRPLVSGNWVFCRRLTKAGVELACFDKQTGNVLWKSRPKASLVSDPSLVQGRLQIFAADVVASGPVDVRLLTLHAETGNVLTEASVVRLFDDPQLHGHPCQSMARDGLHYFAISGVSGCCDSQGQALWLRKQAWTPPAMDPTRYQRAFVPPLLWEDLVLINQPGSPVLEALEARSGRSRWAKSLPDLRRVLGLCEGRLLVETQGGLETLDPRTGDTGWRYRVAELLDAICIPAPPAPVVAPMPPAPAPMPNPLPPPPPRLLVTRLIDGPGNTNYPSLVWLDPQTGRELGYQALEALVDKEPRFGPLLVTEQKIWCLSGKGRADARRDIYELVPAADQVVHQTIDQRLWAGWLPEFQRSSFSNNVGARPNFAKRTMVPSIRDAFARYASGWLAIAPMNQPKEAGIRPELRGQKDVVAVQLTTAAATDEQKQALAGAPIDALRLVRQVRVPKVDDAVLRFRVGHEPGQKWQLIIDGGNCRVHSTIIDDQSAPTGWQDLQISLSHLSGKQTELTITCAPLTAGNTWVYLAGLQGLSVLNGP